MASTSKKDKDSNRKSVDVTRLWHIWNMNGPDLSLSCEICTLLKDNQCRYELDIFLRNLPFEKDYMQDETLNRARICLAFWKSDFEAVYRLIEENSYTNGEDLIDVWDLSHYCEEEIKRQKTLTPLARFRIRQRYMPPKSILPSGKRKKTTLPKDAKKVLQMWLNKNKKYPYPSRELKQKLAEKSGLSQFQVSTWFANARRKLFQKLRNEKHINPKEQKSSQQNGRKRGRKVYQEYAKQIEPEEDNLSQDAPASVAWYPSNQINMFDTDDVLSLRNRVNQCMSSPFLCTDDCQVKQENWSSVYADTNLPTSCIHDDRDTMYLGDQANEILGQEVKNDDAAELLINLSNTLIK